MKSKNNPHQALAIFCRAPVPGLVKTRLAGGIGESRAAELYVAMLRDTFALSVNVAEAVGIKVSVAYTPHDAFDAGSHSLASLWDGPRFSQNGADLGARMLEAISHLQEGGAQKVVLIGSDSPDLPPALLQAAFTALENHDLVFGPSDDGGFYLVGASLQLDPSLFEGVQWSSPETLQQVLSNAEQGELSVKLIAPWQDVDTPEDLQALRRRLINGQSTAPFTQSLLLS